MKKGRLALALIGFVALGGLAQFKHDFYDNRTHSDNTDYVGQVQKGGLPLQQVFEKVEGLDPWSTDYRHDDMRKSVQKFESNRSLNHYTLGFPYNHGSWVDVNLRSANVKEKRGLNQAAIKPKDVYFYLTDGQFQCFYEGCVASVRFDDGKVETFSLSEASDGDTQYLFVNDSGRFIKEVKSHKKMIVELPFYQYGRKQFTFQLNNTVHKVYSSN